MNPYLPKKYASSPERQWALFAHLSALAACVMPVAHLIIPLVIYFSKKEESAFVASHARAALNFQLSIALYCLLASPLVLLAIGIPIIMILGIMSMVCAIIAAIRLDQDQNYRYPISISFFK